MSEAAFMGEIEFAGDHVPGEDFGAFETLPHVEKIHELAREYADVLELMPYQLVGEGMRLLVSVYLESRHAEGKVIAVLTRSPYPPDADALDDLMQVALKRAELLSHLSHRCEEASIASARNALEQLYRKIQAQF
jgi:hypothetical protein